MRKLNAVPTSLILTAVMAATGCAGVSVGSDHIRWTEEVKLSDGSVIQIQRHVELAESGFPVQRRGFNKYYEICYPPMGIHWKSRGGYQPDIFDIVEGKAYMHVPVTSQAECYEQGSPETGAIYFVWENSQWRRIEHDEFPARSEWNLLMSIKAAHGHEKNDPRGIISLEDKELRQTSALLEQKRFGWIRVNESYARRDGCKPYGKGPSWCADAKCTRLRDRPAEPIDIFYTDSSNTCLR
ncbi:MAG: hypothetical protein A2Z65_01995 [Gallionellales bacterium RIFCSPLOWO2_02_58_13]|nr:MAG: hypothetical protein A2Z65_01995 [Gallionellales bacterium RIFCSPLOWO2_02_58_13]